MVRLRLALFSALGVLVLTPEAAAGGGWWSYIDVSRSLVTPGQSSPRLPTAGLRRLRRRAGDAQVVSGQLVVARGCRSDRRRARDHQRFGHQPRPGDRRIHGAATPSGDIPADALRHGVHRTSRRCDPHRKLHCCGVGVRRRRALGHTPGGWLPGRWQELLRCSSFVAAGRDRRDSPALAGGTPATKRSGSSSPPRPGLPDSRPLLLARCSTGA
jgi:hypothetical protein